VRRRVAAALLVVLGACAGADQSGGGGNQAPAAQPPPEVAFTVADQGVIDIPTDVQAGINTISVTNEGADKRAIGFARINDGVPRPKVGIALTKGDFETVFTSSLIGGSVFSQGEIDLLPGDTGTLTTELTEGTYILADPEARRFEPGYFEVGPPSGEEIEEPSAEFTIDEGEYFIKVEETLPAGSHTYALTNVGEQSHELLIFEKKTEKEAAAALAPLPGSTSWIELDLEPGTYTFACFFPDVKDGKLGKKNHGRLGMETTVTVE